MCYSVCRMTYLVCHYVPIMRNILWQFPTVRLSPARPCTVHVHLRLSLHVPRLFRSLHYAECTLEIGSGDQAPTKRNDSSMQPCSYFPLFYAVCVSPYLSAKKAWRKAPVQAHTPSAALFCRSSAVPACQASAVLALWTMSSCRRVLALWTMSSCRRRVVLPVPAPMPTTAATMTKTTAMQMFSNHCKAQTILLLPAARQAPGQDCGARGRCMEKVQGRRLCTDRRVTPGAAARKAAMTVTVMVKTVRLLLLLQGSKR